MGVVLKRENEEKPCYITSAMMALRSYDKLYATWLSFFMRGRAAEAGCHRGIRGLLVILVHSVEQLGGWVELLRLATNHSAHKGGDWALASTFIRSFFARLDECVGNVIRFWVGMMW